MLSWVGDLGNSIWEMHAWLGGEAILRIHLDRPVVGPMHYSASHIHCPELRKWLEHSQTRSLNESTISHADVRVFSQAQDQCEYYEYILSTMLYDRGLNNQGKGCSQVMHSGRIINVNDL